MKLLYILIIWGQNLPGVSNAAEIRGPFYTDRERRNTASLIHNENMGKHGVYRLDLEQIKRPFPFDDKLPTMQVKNFSLEELVP